MLFRDGNVIKVNIAPGVAREVGKRAYYGVGITASRQLVIDYWNEIVDQE
jgi:hypothetical protein